MPSSISIYRNMIELVLTAVCFGFMLIGFKFGQDHERFVNNKNASDAKHRSK